MQIGELRQRLGGLPSPVEAEGIWLEEAHHSTAIEGNTLVLEQVELLLAEIRHVHSLAMTPVREHDIEPLPGGMEPPARTDVPALVRAGITAAEGLRAVDEATIAESLAALRDGRWRSSRAWVDEYRTTRYKRS